MTPVCDMNGCSLWYSPDDGGYYWQDEMGTGMKTSRVYKTLKTALEAMRAGRVQLK